MANVIDDLAVVFARLPGIGPRQARRFVYYLLAAPVTERAALAKHINELGALVKQCPKCLHFHSGSTPTCTYCSDNSRSNSQLMIVEKDQDLAAVERAGTWHGRYFVLGGVLTLSGKGAIREKELIKAVENQLANGLQEVVLALSATSEGEHTADRVRELLLPQRAHIKISTLGRGLATGSELEYSDTETLRAALKNRNSS